MAVPLTRYLRTAYHPDRDYVDGEVRERNWGDFDHSSSQSKVILYFALREQNLSIETLPGLRLRVAPTRVRVADVCILARTAPMPPLLCIEILSPEDRFLSIRDKVDDYLKMGVPHVWVLDPQNKAAYSITAAEGWREEKQTLRTADPALEMPLSAVFS